MFFCVFERKYFYLSFDDNGGKSFTKFNSFKKNQFQQKDKILKGKKNPYES